MAKENYVYSAKLFIYGKKGNLLGGARHWFSSSELIDFDNTPKLVDDIRELLIDSSGVPLSKVDDTELLIDLDEEDEDEDEDEDEEDEYRIVR